MQILFSRKQYIKVTLRDPENKLTYEPGDHAAVFPCNADADIDYIATRLTGFKGSVTMDTPIKLLVLTKLDDGKMSSMQS